MSNQGMTIAEAAQKLGVSTRTIRRYIKAGKIGAELVAGAFGKEYRILEIPANIVSLVKEGDSTRGEDYATDRSLEQALQMIKELQDKNMALAAQLGAATERIKSLEMQVKLLNTPRKPWWKRLFGWD